LKNKIKFNQLDYIRKGVGSKFSRRIHVKIVITLLAAYRHKGIPPFPLPVPELSIRESPHDVSLGKIEFDPSPSG
jgi:hypothetical protein